MISERLYQRYLATVCVIAASPYVESYVIGYTSGSIESRFQTYRKLEYKHIVVLANGLSEHDALGLEERLFKGALEDRRYLSWRRYHRVKRCKRYFRSSGPRSRAPDSLIHSVYMAWWEPAPGKAIAP